MQNRLVSVKEKGILLSIPFDACVLYHGRDSIGGLALGFRLIQWGLNYLRKNGEIPSREDITFRTAFPGPGLKDAVEMLTRAVSRSRYEEITQAPEAAPEGVYGRMYFEIGLKDKKVCVYLKPGVLSEDFVNTGRLIKSGEATVQDLKHWTEVKEALAETVWSVEDFSSVLVICD